jgi:nitrite reductase (NADH) large subunit
MRKRIRRFRLGDFGWYRVFHASVGAACVALVSVHTGLSMGNNLNRALLLVFLGVVATGGVVGMCAASESGGVGRAALVARRWRPWVMWTHWVLLWLLPVFVTFHVVAAYVF